MSEVRLDAEKAERIIGRFCDRGKLPPAKANELAATICRRLTTSMAKPNSLQLQGYRMVSLVPDRGEVRTAF